MTDKVTFNCLKFSSLLIFLLNIQVIHGQGIKGKVKEVGLDRFTSFDHKFTQNQKLFGNESVAQIWTDTLVYKREAGGLDSRAVVPIGDLSKWLTTVLVLMYVDEGKISLDDKVIKYIPLFSKYGKNYITIRHCLTNYSGIEAEAVSQHNLHGRKKYSSLEELVNDYPKDEIKSNPGTEFRYSNDGFDIAGRIIEIVSKKKFEMIIKQRLFNPLGMRQTSFSTLDASAPVPAGGAVSSANDYMQFLKMLLNNGVFNGQHILSEASVKELKTLQSKPQDIKASPKITEGLSYAPGSWVLEANNNEATSLTTAALFGSWATVDWCRGYAMIVLCKDLQNELKKEVFFQFKEAVDEQSPSHCK